MSRGLLGRVSFSFRPRGWISVRGFPRMDPAKFAEKSVNFELFSTFPFFESALILPRTDHFKLLVCISVRGSWSILFHVFPFKVTYCSSRWFAILGPFPAATIDFSHPFPTCLESVPPRPRSPLFLARQTSSHGEICTARYSRL